MKTAQINGKAIKILNSEFQWFAILVIAITLSLAVLPHGASATEGPDDHGGVRPEPSR